MSNYGNYDPSRPGHQPPPRFTLAMVPGHYMVPVHYMVPGFGLALVPDDHEVPDVTSHNRLPRDGHRGGHRGGRGGVRRGGHVHYGVTGPLSPQSSNNPLGNTEQRVGHAALPVIHPGPSSDVKKSDPSDLLPTQELRPLENRVPSSDGLSEEKVPLFVESSNTNPTEQPPSSESPQKSEKSLLVAHPSLRPTNTSREECWQNPKHPAPLGKVPESVLREWMKFDLVEQLEPSSSQPALPPSRESQEKKNEPASTSSSRRSVPQQPSKSQKPKDKKRVAGEQVAETQCAPDPLEEIAAIQSSVLPIPKDSPVYSLYKDVEDKIIDFQKTDNTSSQNKQLDFLNKMARLRELMRAIEVFIEALASLPEQKADHPVKEDASFNFAACQQQLEVALNLVFQDRLYWKLPTKWNLLLPIFHQEKAAAEEGSMGLNSETAPKRMPRLLLAFVLGRAQTINNSLRTLLESKPDKRRLKSRKSEGSTSNDLIFRDYMEGVSILLRCKHLLNPLSLEDSHPVVCLLGAMSVTVQSALFKTIEIKTIDEVIQLVRLLEVWSELLHNSQHNSSQAYQTICKCTLEALDGFIKKNPMMRVTVQSVLLKTIEIKTIDEVIQLVRVLEVWPELPDNSQHNSCQAYHTICKCTLEALDEFLKKNPIEKIPKEYILYHIEAYLFFYSTITRITINTVNTVDKSFKVEKNNPVLAIEQHIVALSKILHTANKRVPGACNRSLEQLQVQRMQLRPYYLHLAYFLSKLDIGCTTVGLEAVRVLYQLGLGGWVIDNQKSMNPIDNPINNPIDAGNIKWQVARTPTGWVLKKSNIPYDRTLPKKDLGSDTQPPLDLCCVDTHYHKLVENLEHCGRLAMEKGALAPVLSSQDSVSLCVRWASQMYEFVLHDLVRSGNQHPMLGRTLSCFAQSISDQHQEWAVIKDNYTSIMPKLVSGWNTCIQDMQSSLNGEKILEGKDAHSKSSEAVKMINHLIQDSVCGRWALFVTLLQKEKVDAPLIALLDALGLQHMKILALQVYGNIWKSIVSDYSPDIDKNRHLDGIKEILTALQTQLNTIAGLPSKSIVFEVGLAALVQQMPKEGMGDPLLSLMKEVLCERPCTMQEECPAYVFPEMSLMRPYEDWNDIQAPMALISTERFKKLWKEDARDELRDIFFAGMEQCLRDIEEIWGKNRFQAPPPSVTAQQPLSDALCKKLREIPWMRFVVPERNEEVDRMSVYWFMTHLWIARLIEMPMVMRCDPAPLFDSLEHTQKSVRTMAQTVYRILHNSELPESTSWDAEIQQQVREPCKELFPYPSNLIFRLA